MTDVTIAPDLMMPQISLRTMSVPQPDAAEKRVMMLVVETAVTHYEFLLCTPENYRETANKLAQSIIQIGDQDLKGKEASRLIAVKGGLPDGLKNGHPRSPQRRK